MAPASTDSLLRSPEYAARPRLASIPLVSSAVSRAVSAAAANASEAPAPRAVVLYAHGNAGNVAGWAWVLRLFRDRLGCSVLVFDYRGYGRSEGAPDEAGILVDARAARRWLAQRTGVAESEIVLVGTSLGGAVAVDLAAADGARGLVLESTFTSLPQENSKRVVSIILIWRFCLVRK